jgi:putative nucleotidyltransferase with HDIG domain
VTALDAARAALEGQQAWVVGGAVRDRMLGRDVFDLDLVIAGDPEEVSKTLAREARGPRFQLSDAFGAWRVLARDRSWQVDLMVLQGDSIEADLAQRDFTLNAMAEPLAGGPVLDPFDGAGDIERNQLRMVSEHAFDEDPLRVLRLVRFACELGLEPQPETKAAAAARAPRINEVAAERIFAELRRVISAPDVLDGLALMQDIGLTAVLLPEIEALHGVEQNLYHHLDVYDHTLQVLAEVLKLEEDPAAVVGEQLAPAVTAYLQQSFADDITHGTALRMGALFHDAAKPQTQAHHDDGSVLGFPGHADEGAELARAILKRLHTSERLRAHQAALARHHLRAGYLVRHAPLDRRTVYQYLLETGDVAVDVTLLSIADRLATRGCKADEAIPKHIGVALELLGPALDAHANGFPEPLVRGDDLGAALGIEPGPEVGRMLAEIAAAQYAQEISTRDEAIEFARSLL